MASLIQAYGQDFEQVIEGGGQDISVSELSSGAKINKVFHERFPFELVKVSWGAVGKGQFSVLHSPSCVCVCVLFLSA